MKGYEKACQPQVFFGSGTAVQAGPRFAACGIKKCLIVTDDFISGHSLTQKVTDSLTHEGIVWEMFTGVMPEPTDTLCFALGKQIKEGGYDSVLGIGGGSPMDAAKAACIIAGIPEEIGDLHDYSKSGTKMQESWKRPCFLCLMPTTAGTGAETTLTGVLTSERFHLKFSFGNRYTTADMAIIDPEFTLGMPAMPTIYGAVDALTHSVEMLIGTGSNEYTNTTVLNGIEKIWTWLPVSLPEAQNLEAREQLAWAAHNALANGGMANGHAVAHAIGASYHLVHGHACMVVLPTLIRHHSESAQAPIAALARRIGVPVTGDASTDAGRVANAILSFYKKLGMKPVRQAMEEKCFHDDLVAFQAKIIPATLDDFKCRLWMPPIHTGDSQAKVGKICEMIYNEE